MSMFTADAILLRSPLKFLYDTIEAERFLEGVIVAVMYFERFGKDKLKQYFKSKEIPLEPLKINNLRVKRVWELLEGFDIITHDTHSLMGEVCKQRNDIVHKLRHPDEIDEEKAKIAIEKAIKCLKALGETR